eukprot:CAMPEP_0118641428 /NCGR_PEP_ID=MMETSP0785-20121206/5278_1 /TAXON_ID=91992 /ORGANISM="Bolidomonas pacifica, Strain CCMP 1866" /LENGTH=37 /DNA_ID= /DNA_START= /DNA_END= /DNA_ORIENTATION=
MIVVRAENAILGDVGEDQGYHFKPPVLARVVHERPAL